MIDMCVLWLEFKLNVFKKAKGRLGELLTWHAIRNGYYVQIT